MSERQTRGEKRKVRREETRQKRPERREGSGWRAREQEL